MNKPRLTTYMLGNGPTTFLLMAGCAVSAYLWWAGKLGGEIAFLSLLAAAWASRAQEELSRYRRWCAQWDSCSQSATARPGRGLPIKSVLLLAGILGWLYLLGTATPGQPNLALGWLTLALVAYAAIVLVAAVVRRIRRPRSGAVATRANQPWVLVEVVVPRSSVPTLEQAVHGLPDYCKNLMRWPISPP